MIADAPQTVVSVADQRTGAAHLVSEDLVARRRPMLAMCGQEFLPAALCAPLGRPCPRCHEVVDTRRATATTSDGSSRSLRRLVRWAGLDDQRARRAPHLPPGPLVTTANRGRP